MAGRCAGFAQASAVATERRWRAMHELSLCRSIYGIVERAAGGQHVISVTLEVGELRQVIPDTLRYCWGIVTEETPLANSQLLITQHPGLIICDDCGHQTAMRSIPRLRCDHCSGTDVRVISGEEFMVRSLEVAN
jgi:hydrogenase nickel incorporation protein HypA/HybF